MPADVTGSSNVASGLAGIFNRPPFIGLFAFVIVFVFQGLGHTIMIVMEHALGEGYLYHSAFAMGLAGAALLFWGMKSTNEVTATWLGFWAGSFLWTGWVEFAFVWSGNYLGVPDQMDPHMPGEIATKAEYLVMMSSVGVMMATLVYFIFNKETKCNCFLWMQRHLHMKVGRPTPSYERNYAGITALETIYVIWFFYLLLLFIYDESILGDRHPVTYAIFFANTVWGVYLLQRLVKFWRVPTAIRYGIPTAIVCWTSVEIAGRWHLFTEFWEKPVEYALEMSLIVVAIAVAAVLAARAPANPKTMVRPGDLAKRGA